MFKNNSSIGVFAILIICMSCSSSNESEIIEDPDEGPLGSIAGSVKLIGNESLEYQGLKLKLLENNEIVEQFNFESNNNKYTFKDLKLGEYIMVVEKEGYGVHDSLKIDNSLGTNSLSQIEFLEFPKIEINLVSLDYDSGQIFREILSCFESNVPQTILYEYFFSKDSKVSYLNFDLRYGAAGVRFGNTNIDRPCSQITIPARSWETYPFSNFTDAGFEIGDKVYVKVYPVHELFYETIDYYPDSKNFEVIQHIRMNGSNTVEFVL